MLYWSRVACWFRKGMELFSGVGSRALVVGLWEYSIITTGSGLCGRSNHSGMGKALLGRAGRILEAIAADSRNMGSCEMSA